MPIDPSIILQATARQPQFTTPDPLDNYAKIMAIKGGMGQEDLRGVQLQQLRKNIADEDAVSAAYQQSGGDSATLRALLYKGGQHKAVQALDKFNLETEEKRSTIGKNKAQTDKANNDVAAKKYELIGSSMAFVRDNPTQQNAYQAIDNLAAQGVLTADEAAKAKATTPADPEQIRALATQHFQAALSAKDQLPKIETRNIGGQTQTLAVNPVTGKVDVTNSVTNTQSPDNLASTTATMRGQNMTQATAQRGQNMTDARERDVSLAGRKQEAGAAGRTVGEATATAAMNLPQVTDTADRAIRLVDDLIGTRGRELKPGEKAVAPHAGFEGAVGVSGVGSGFGAAGFIPGTDTTDFKRRLDELKGGAFLQAFNSLKGGGQITEIEGKKATEAITRMSASQSEGEFVKAAREFQDVIRAGVKRAQTQAGTKAGKVGGVLTKNADGSYNYGSQ